MQSVLNGRARNLMNLPPLFRRRLFFTALTRWRRERFRNFLQLGWFALGTGSDREVWHGGKSIEDGGHERLGM